MADRKIIAVVGATGAQGGGLVRAILADPDGGFTARALTRDPSSEKAQALAALGAEVVRRTSTTRRASSGRSPAATASSASPSSGRTSRPSTEMARRGTWPRPRRPPASSTSSGRRSRTRATWSRSTMTACRRSGASTRCPTSTRKGEADHALPEAGVPTTFLRTSFYWDNFIYFGMGPKRGEDGKLAITFPMGDAKLPGIAAEDIGKCAYGDLQGAATSSSARPSRSPAST